MGGLRLTSPSGAVYYASNLQVLMSEVRGFDGFILLRRTGPDYQSAIRSALGVFWAATRLLFPVSNLTLVSTTPCSENIEGLSRPHDPKMSF